jgi:ribose 1,5-bisphosphokinase
MTGTLLVVVGPSGAGKDTILTMAQQRLQDEPQVVFAQRFITRPTDVTEDSISITEREFGALEAEGGFFLSWRANGLGYALPAGIVDDLKAGRIIIANVSRGIVDEARRKHPSTLAVEITAAPETLVARLARRGREASDDQRQRLLRNARYADTFRADIKISNDAAPAEAADRFIQVIRAYLTAPVQVEKS